ncbi:unnamed protein product [Diamesa serratosioi]
MPVIEPNNNAAQGKEKCRTCVDFKSWAKQQRKSLSTTDVKKDENKEVQESPLREDCPWDKNMLGKSTWGLLHTIAANYPEKPTPENQKDVSSFFSILSRLYPCEYCAKDLQVELVEIPPVTKSQEALSQWLCKLHNRVNIKIGKPEFDCSKVNQRWRDGWLDGSCD